MKNKSKNKNEFVTYEDICEEAFGPTIALMMKKYDVLSMTNDELGNAYQEVRDAVEDGSEEFKIAYDKVISKLIRRYKKRGVFDMNTHPDEIKAKEDELEEQRFREAKARQRKNNDGDWNPVF